MKTTSTGDCSRHILGQRILQEGKNVEQSGLARAVSPNYDGHAGQIVQDQMPEKPIIFYLNALNLH